MSYGPLEEGSALAPPSDSQGASFTVGLTTLGASMMGISILSLPIATLYVGYALAPPVFLAVGLLADLSLCTIVRTAQLTKEQTYAGVGRKCFGATGDVLVLLSLLSVLLGCAVAGLLVVAQLTTHTLVAYFQIAPDHAVLAPNVMCALVLACLYPIALLPNLSVLAPTSTAALVGLTYVVLVIVFSWFQNGSVPDVEPMRVSSSLFSTLSILASAYLCHFNIIPIYAELRAPDKPRIFRLIHVVTLGVTTPMYIGFGLAGYLQLGRHTIHCSNVLRCFTAPAIRAGATAIGAACFLKLPLLIVPFRAALNEALLAGPPHPVTVLGETLLLFFAIHAVACSVGDVGRACSLVGATAGTTIMFILPGLFYARAHQLAGSLRAPQLAVSAVLVVAGVLLMVLGLFDL